VIPSAKALKKERKKLHEMTDHRQCYKPIPQLIQELNRHLRVWKNYFNLGTRVQPFVTSTSTFMIDSCSI